MDLREFTKNRQQFPVEELAKYAGKYVAWSPDGKKILSSDEDMLQLDSWLKTAGHDPAEILVSFVPGEM